MIIILEVGASKYVGGALTATGYGTTKIKSLAICFRSVKEATDWMVYYGIDAYMIDYETGRAIM